MKIKSAMLYMLLLLQCFTVWAHNLELSTLMPENVGYSGSLVLSTSGDNGDCGVPDGSACVDVTGGIQPYSYKWSNGDTTYEIDDIPSGSYTVTVTDARGNSATTSIMLTCDDALNPGIEGDVWSQIGGDIDGELAFDKAGRSVAISDDGSIIAIGASTNDQGKVKVYQKSAGNWVQLGTDINGTVTNGYIGYAVSLSSDGSVLAVSTTYSFGGKVEVFGYINGNWVQKGAAISASYSSFGYSVSLSSDGNTLAIGSPTYNNNTGRVRIYTYDGANWILGGLISGASSGNYFGRSVSLSDDGQKIAIGAPNNLNNSGYVRVFEYQSGAWVQLGNTILGEASSDFSGASVSLSADGSIVAIGAQYNDGNGGSSGHVRVFEYSSNWVQLGSDIDGNVGDESGFRVSLSFDGKTVAVASPYANSDTGLVRIYDYNGVGWSQIGSDINGEASGDYFGYSIALDANGTSLVVGVPNNDVNGTESGKVKVFELLQEETACYNESTTLSYNSVTGGSGSYTYQWEVSTDAGVTWANAPGTSTQETYTISALTETSYFRRLVVDATCGGQEYSNNTKVIVNDEIVISSSITDATTCGNSDGMVNILVTGGSGEYTYLWDNGETTASINGFAAGDYELTVTDTYGCTVFETYTISEDCSGMWTGAVSTDWGTTGNWANAVVPTEIDDVTISAAPANQPVITSGVEISNLTVAAGAMLTVSDGGTLIVTGTSTGEITVERSIGTEWFFTSCPVHGETIADFVANNDLASGTGENIGFGLYTTNTDTWMYLTQTILSVSGANEIPVGTGIAVKKSAPGKLTFTGTYNTLPTASDLGYGGVGDFNLVGNPFIANINVATVLNANSGGLNESTMWLWQGGAYITKNILTGGTLEPLDGFIVSSNSADSSINFTTSMMQSASTGFPPNPTAGITSFTLTLSNDSQTYGTDIYLLGGATTGIDNGFDSSMFTGSGNDFAVYTKAVSGGSTKKLAIQAIPVANFDQYTIPVGVKTAIGGTVTFSLSMTQNLGVDQYVYLYDNVTSSNTELTNGGTYQVTLPQGTDGSGRFYINMAATPMGTDSIDMDRIKIIGSTSTITILGLEQEATLTLFNMLGQQLVQRNLEAVSNQQVQVDVARGTYVVKVTNSSGATTSKVVIGK